jgi:Exopolysaccharide biosynthesis protein YbjH
LMAEYSGDDYAVEQSKHLVQIRSPINFGLSYKPIKQVELGVDWMYGRELALRLTLTTNLMSGGDGLKADPPPLVIRVRSDEEKLRGQLREELNVVGTPNAKPSKTASQANADLLANRPAEIPLPGPAAASPPPPEPPPTPDLMAANSAAMERIRGELARLGMTLDKFEIADSQAMLLVVPATGQAPLPCEVMWHQVSVDGLVGVTAITFINAAGGREVYRCTKFIDPDAPKPAPLVARTAQPETTAPPDSESPAARGFETALPGSQNAQPQLGFVNDDDKTVADKVRRLLSNQGVPLEALKLDHAHHEAIVYFTNPTYIKVGKALGRVARALTQVLPPDYEIITLVETLGAINGATFQFSRSELERIAISSGSPEELLASTSSFAAEPGFPRHPTYKRNRFLKFYPTLAPAFRDSLFDPDDPFRYQFMIRAGGIFELGRGVGIDAIYDINLYNDFDKITRVTQSELPRVRTDYRYYLQRGASGFEHLQLTVLHQFAPEWTGRLAAGYLEDMYGGVSGEVLYSPYASRWAFGGEVSQVWKRSFDRLFGFYKYNVVTGHFSIYYQTPFHDFNVAVHVGRYLAKDYGATFEVSRRFGNGAEVGAWATFTNVPFSKFGEGSFDKGIRITIPLDFYSLFSTKEANNIVLTPLTRDGGARLDSSPQLYPLTRDLSYGEATRTWDDFLDDR